MIEAIEGFIRWVGSSAPIALVITFLIWLVLLACLLGGRRLADRYHRIFRDVASRQDGPGVQAMLSGLPTAIVMDAALDPAMPAKTASVLAGHVVSRFVSRLGADRVLRAASESPGGKHEQRRIRALRFLALAGHPRRIALLDTALHSGRYNLVDAAVSILGNVQDERAAQLLVRALQEGLFQASRVATELDHFPVPISHLIRPLLETTDTGVRYWATALAARYLNVEGFSEAVLRLTGDGDPRVRKAAIQALRFFPDPNVPREAARLTSDPVFYVRAHAARTLAACGDPGAAPCIVRLLGDPEWWVRLAARESLALFGPAVVPAVAPLLESSDPVVAEGAAAILYNVGYVDEMIRKLTGHREQVAVTLLRPLVAAGGELFVSTVLARYSSAETPAAARLESALRRAATS